MEHLTKGHESVEGDLHMESPLGEIQAKGHYREGRLKAQVSTRQLQAASGAPVFVPQPQTPPQLALQFGPFCVEYHQFAHTPVPGWDAITHGVYFISAAGVSVYVTADARIDAVQHRAILRGRRADAAFWNGQILSYPETRALLPEAAKKNYVYHIPVDEKDACGVRRKCERNMARFGAELPKVSLLEAYPSQILL